MNPIIKEFIREHYDEKQPDKQRLLGLLKRTKQQQEYYIKAGYSTLIVIEESDNYNKESKKNNPLEIMLLRQSNEDFKITITPHNATIENYINDLPGSNAIVIKATPNEKLNQNYRRMTPQLILAQLFHGEETKLDETEKKYYNEINGIELPINIQVIKQFKIKPGSEKEVNDYLTRALQNKKISIYSKFRNGPLQYYFRNKQLM